VNVYKEVEKLTDFHLQQLKSILDKLPLFEIVDQTSTKLVVRQEAKHCISMKELISNWEMVSEEDDLITFCKIDKDSRKLQSEN